MLALRDYQDALVGDLRQAYASGSQSPLLVLPTGGGKCLARGTPVLMYDGTIKAVDEIKVGELLMGPNSRPRTVLSTCHGREQMYKITPKKGTAYVVNASHILSLKISGNDETVTGGDGVAYRGGDIANISITDYLQSSKTFRHRAKGWRVGTDFAPQSDILPLDPYILGVWLGDGNARCTQVCNVDHEVIDALEDFANRLEFVSKKTLYSPDRVPVTAITLINKTLGGRGHSNNAFLNALRDINVLQNKHIPHVYKTASRAERLELLAGLLDTDGYLHHNGFDIVSKWQHLADDIVYLARSLGLAAYVSESLKRCGNTGAEGVYYRVSISGNTVNIPCRVERRKPADRKQKKSVLVTGIDVVAIGVDDYFGFEIDGDRLFMLGDFTVTHNTVVFTYMATRAAEKGKRVLLLGHRRELITQMSAALKLWGCPHGVISPTAKINNAPVQVGMVQTIANRINLDKQGRYKFDLVIIDEAHHATKNSTWGRVLQHNAGAKLLGVSATPCRLDGKGLGLHADGFFDRMVIGPTMPELIALGNLVRPVVYAPANSIDLSGVKKSRGDFALGALAGAVDRAPITGNAINEYKQYADRRSAIAFTVTVEHAEHVVDQFKTAGYQAAVLTGSTPDRDRARMIRDLGNGSLHVLASCNVVSEGTDIPAVFAAILLRPTASYALAMQQIGRALRPSAGKDRAIILDHADNVRRHGLPTDEVDWTLDGLRRKQGKNTKATTKICTGCRCHLALQTRVCPECGLVVKGGASRTDSIVERDGELVELSPEMLAERRKKRGQELKSARTKRDLVRLGTERGYKNPGFWADKILEDRRQWAANRGRVAG